MVDDIFDDYQTKLALQDSEVWTHYFNAELASEEARKKEALVSQIDDENQIFDELEQFRQKVSGNPALKNQLRKVCELIEQHPEIKEKVDINFLNGLEMLDLED
jgi:hypothetical protein